MAERKTTVEGLVVNRVFECYRGKRVLVTGATGFVGRHLVAQLEQAGAHVRVAVHRRPWPEPDAAISSVPGDLNRSDLPYWETACRDCDVIFHLAAAGVVGETEASALLQQHVVGPAALLEAAANVGVQGFIHTSSCFVYGHRLSRATRAAAVAPVSPYAASKVAAETWLAALGRRFGLPVACARLFHVYGPGEHAQRLIPYVLNQLAAGERLELTAGHQVRDFLFVADAVDGLLHLGANLSQHAGSVVNLGSGRATSVRELVATAQALFTAPGDAVFGARPDRPDSLPFLVADADESETVLGWRARVPLHQGLARTAQALCLDATPQVEAKP